MNPEDSATFRLARLTLLLAVVGESAPDGVDAERLGIYDFLAAHPLLVVHQDGDPDRLALRLAGFDGQALAYASPAQRFVTSQLRLGSDLAVLVGWGLVSVTAAGRITYRLTAEGMTVAAQFAAQYSRSYTAAARIVIRRSRHLSGRKLRGSMRNWITVPPKPTPGRLDPAHVIDLDSYIEASPFEGPAQAESFPEDEK